MSLIPYVNFITSHLNKAYLLNSAVQVGVEQYKVQDTKSFQSVNKVQTVFDVVNVGCALWALKQLWDVIDARFLITTAFASYDPVYLGLALVVVAVAWFFGAEHIVSKINEKTKPKEDLNQWHKDLNLSPFVLNEIKVKWEIPSSQRITQMIYVTQIVISVAMIILSSSPLFFAINAGLQIYGLAKITSCKWIRFDRSFPIFNRDRTEGPQKFTLSYFFSTLAPKNNQENCAICLEDKPTSSFCSEHAFHNLCLIGQIYGKSNYFFNHLKYKRIHVVERNQYGVQTGERIDYRVELKKDNMPACALCRNNPPQNVVEVHVDDVFRGRYGSSNAQVTLV